MAHTYNPSYSGGRDQKDCGLNPAQANSSWDYHEKYSTKKRASGVAQVVEYPPTKCEAKFKPQYWGM
jgi:hypothetical protein